MMPRGLHGKYSNYHYCIVRECKNTSIKTPGKLWIKVPNKINMRYTWLRLAKRDPESLSNDTQLYICEDHFDLENDMENYMQYKLMGSVKRVRMRPGCMPSRFQYLAPDNIQHAFKRSAVMPVLKDNHQVCPMELSTSLFEQVNVNIEVGVEDSTEALEEAQDTETEQFTRCSQCDEVISGFVFVCVQCVVRVCGACDAREHHATHYVLRVPSGRPESEIELLVDKLREGLSAAGIQVCTQAQDEVKVEFIPEIKTEVEDDEDPLGGVGYEAPGPPREPAAAGSQVVPELVEVKTEPPDSTRQDETASPDMRSLASTSQFTSTLHGDSQPPAKRRNVGCVNVNQCVTYPSHAPLRTISVRPLKSTDAQSSSTSNADPGLTLYTFLDPGIPGSSGVGPQTQVELRFRKQKPSQRFNKK